MEINKFIDHTLLKPNTTEEQIKKLCEEANQYKFASVCVAPCWESIARPLVHNLCIVSDFPHGNCSIKIPRMLSSVDEIDYVINIGFVKSNMQFAIEENIRTMREMSGNKIAKCIVEVGYLTDEELFKIADLLIKHKIDFIKTCTGYGPRDVTVEDIIKIKKHVGDRIKIKASGGIRTAEFARQLIEAGADRIGTSSSVSIMKEIQS